ncbi:MAG: hypothetical protein Q7S88_03550 [Candidatus Daviesbacteria bacterium]|nr:hypothetical protein [Candidatus Daviesbacteria bacterium]
MAISNELAWRETNQALNLVDELNSRQDDTLAWRNRVDQNLQYFTKEYVLKEDITRYSYNLVAGDEGLPVMATSPGYESQGDVINSFGGKNRTEFSRQFGAREEAEYKSFAWIEQEIFSGRGSDRFFVWDSRPGKAEDGYGDYGFTFIGKVEKDRIEMMAYRNHLKNDQVRSFLNKYLNTGSQVKENPTDVDLLQAPVFLPTGGRFKSHLDVIEAIEPIQVSSIEERGNEAVLDSLKPFRRVVISALEMGDLEGARRARRAHNNFAVALLEGRIDDDFSNNQTNGVAFWAAQKPTVLIGSCGKSEDGEPYFGAGLTYLGADLMLKRNKKEDWFKERGLCRNPNCLTPTLEQKLGPCKICKGCQQRVERQEERGTLPKRILQRIGDLFFGRFRA